jgi:hypothetical protein
MNYTQYLLYADGQLVPGVGFWATPSLAKRYGDDHLGTADQWHDFDGDVLRAFTTVDGHSYEVRRIIVNERYEQITA